MEHDCLQCKFVCELVKKLLKYWRRDLFVDDLEPAFPLWDAEKARGIRLKVAQQSGIKSSLRKS